MNGKKRTILLLVVLVLAFIAYQAISIVLFSTKTEWKKSDAAIVLGAAAWGDEPSPVLKERIHHASWLYHQGYVDHIIFTGGGKEDGQLAESEVSRNYARSLDVKESDMFIETKSTITEENIRYAKSVAEKNGFHTFLIVSDPLHMKRAMMIAEDLEVDAYPSPTSSSAYQSWRTQVPFFFRELFFTIGYIVSIPLRWLGVIDM